MTTTAAPQTPQQPPAPARLLMLTNGRRIAQVVYALAEAGVADAVAAGATTVPAIAERTGTDPDALRRMLRCAATAGVFSLGEDGTVALTEMADALRVDSPVSQRDLILFNGDPICSRPYVAITTTLRTGRPAFDEVYGTDFFSYLRSEPGAGELFDRAMVGMSQRSTDLLLDAADFGRFPTVVDVGGGRGLFLSRLLARHPGVRGTLVDQPQVVAEAVTDPAVGERMTVHGGSFFVQVPAGAAAYVLKAVLHDWDDDDAVAILRTIRTAIGGDTDARLLVLEHVLAPGDAWDQGKYLDIDMLLRFGGRERDLGEWTALLARAGFALVAPPRTGGWAVLECRPV